MNFFILFFIIDSFAVPILFLFPPVPIQVYQNSEKNENSKAMIFVSLNWNDYVTLQNIQWCEWDVTFYWSNKYINIIQGF